MINNRQNGRRRGRGGGGQRPGGGGNPNMGNRIDNRARGNAAQLLEKYKTLARDAQMQGDRVNTEYYLQFADHYFRVLSEQRGRAEEQTQRRPRDDAFDPYDLSGDDEFGDEGEPVRGAEQNGEQNGRDTREERGNRDDRGQREERGNRQARDDRAFEGRQREDRGFEPRQRDDRPYEGRQREDRAPRGGNRDQQRDARGDQPQADERGDQRVAQANVMPANDQEDAAAAEPRRRGRPRKVRSEEGAGEGAATFDAAILPPSLGIAAAAPEDGEGEAAEKPRRRRTRAAGGEATQVS